MLYSIIKPERKFDSNQVNVTKTHLKKNKLWKINDGEFILHAEETPTLIMNEIGVTKRFEGTNLFNYDNEILKKILMHFVKTGVILDISFEGFSDPFCPTEDHEIDDFISKSRLARDLTENQLKDIEEHYDYIIDELSPKYEKFNLVNKNGPLVIYSNSAIYMNSNDEELALGIYKEIFKLMNTPFDLEDVKIKEKKKSPHPLQNSHSLLDKLFSLSGEEARTSLDIPKDEFENMKEEMLKIMNNYKGKKVYSK